MQQNQPKAFTEEDMVTDILSTEKQLMDSLNVSITESSCTNLRQVFSSIYQQTCQDQFQTFDNMRQRGWYKTKDATDAEVQTSKQAMDQLRTQLMG